MSLRGLAKNAIFDACRYLGVNSASRALLRNRLLILCYHGVIRDHQKDRFGYGNTVSVAEFDRQLEFIARTFHPLSAADAVQWHRGALRTRATPVLVTFDDGYRNNLSLAAGVLKAKGIPAVFHISTTYIGTDRILWTDEMTHRIVQWPLSSLPLPDGQEETLPPERNVRRRVAVRIKDWCKRLPAKQTEAYLEKLRTIETELPRNEELLAFMNWDEVRALHRNGFDIGAHTLNHPILTRVSPERLRNELIESKSQIEKELHSVCSCVAYPNGGSEDVSPAVIQAAREADYQLGFTIAERFSDRSEDPLALSRVCVQGHLPLSDFEWRASGLETLYRVSA